MIGYVWNEITVTVTGSVIRSICCEQCQHEYAFIDEKEAACEAYSAFMLDDAGAKRVARKDAEKKVERLLAAEVGAVPCPQCGWYQSTMLRAIRRERHKWMWKAAWNLFRFSPVIGLATGMAIAAWKEILEIRGNQFGNVFLLSMFGSLILAPLLPVLRWLLARAYNPNRAIPQEKRKELGQAEALTPEEKQKYGSDG